MLLSDQPKNSNRGNQLCDSCGRAMSAPAAIADRRDPDTGHLVKRDAAAVCGACARILWSGPEGMAWIMHRVQCRRGLVAGNPKTYWYLDLVSRKKQRFRVYRGRHRGRYQ